MMIRSLLYFPRPESLGQIKSIFNMASDPEDDVLGMLVCMGFSPRASARAVAAVGQNLEMAMLWITEESAAPQPPVPSPAPSANGNGGGLASKMSAIRSAATHSPVILSALDGGPAQSKLSVSVASPTSSSSGLNSLPSPQAAAAVPVDDCRAALTDMGFDDSAITLAVGHFGADAAAATHWILSGMPASGIPKKKPFVLARQPSDSTAAASAAVGVVPRSSSSSSSTAASPFFAISDSAADAVECFGLPLREINAQFLVHKAVFNQDLIELREYCRHPTLLHTRDPHGSFLGSLFVCFFLFSFQHLFISSRKGMAGNKSEGRGGIVLNSFVNSRHVFKFQSSNSNTTNPKRAIVLIHPVSSQHKHVLFLWSIELFMAWIYFIFFYFFFKCHWSSLGRTIK
jgi:hypothetical protein